MRYGGEHVGTVCGRALNAISMIDTTFSGFVVDVEVLKVIVEVDGAGAEVSTEEGGMCCEYCCHVNVTFAAEGDSKACLPLVEMGYHGSVKLERDILYYDALMW